MATGNSDSCLAHDSFSCSDKDGIGISFQVVMLAMYNLSLEGTGRQGYFRWKEDICAFIGRHWNFLLGTRSLDSCF